MPLGMDLNDENKRVTKEDVKSGDYVSSGEFEDIPSDLAAKDTDSIAEELTKIGDETISSSLASSIEVEETVSESKITEIDQAIKKADEVRRLHDTKIKQDAIDSLFGTTEQRELYFKNMANLMYREIHNKAKAFLKDWAYTNGFRQKWRNPFLREFSVKHLTPLSEFIPQVYSLSMINMETSEEIELAAFKPTSREACIHGAKKLGFDTSTYKTKAMARFSSEVRKVLQEDDRFLREQRDLHIYEEHRRQVEMRRYVSKHMREKWMQDIEAELAKSTSRII